ncbi:MAG: orotate phosphoribosyltransferase [Candidatus Margulisiibacteriota bacterium]
MSTSLLKKLKEAAYLEGHFVTRSGKETTYYIDKYLFETRPEILGPLAKELAALFPDPSTYDVIAAPELGAVALAAVVSLELQKPFVIVRKETKGYGTKRLVEGKLDPGSRVVVLEDILTTGGAVLAACDVLVRSGAVIQQLVGVLNRQEGAFENIQKQGYSVTALFTTSDLQSC